MEHTQASTVKKMGPADEVDPADADRGVAAFVCAADMASLKEEKGQDHL